MVWFIPFKCLPTTFETADQLFRHVFRIFGLREDIVSDRGPQFTSRVWKELLRKLNITVSLTSGYHLQANGQVERVNQELGRFLRLYTQQHPEAWSAYLPWAEYAQNSLHHAGTGVTPFECILGYQPPLYPWNPPTSEQPAVEMWCRRSEQVWEETHQRLRRAIANYNKKVDRQCRETPRYELGQKVWVSMRDSQAGSTGKLNGRYEGPYTVTKRVNEVTYKIGLPGNSRASWAFHVSSLKPVLEGPLAEEGNPPGTLPQPLDIEEGPAYKVHALLDSRQRGMQLQYLVDWEGYNLEEQCWILASQILDPNFSTSFHREHPLKLAPRLPGRPHSRREKGSSTLLNRTVSRSLCPETPDPDHNLIIEPITS
ncbi:hypothetical protein P4O66_002756 [Electrophorus voltai]|uniref:Integrase catalytic domain-containing protein n=1 Tax=Electrophorus voltai TaxID=2609070 RepID=A0AAD8YU55_9TELE|nr:hypothetical protein P4O66_002756 [Electrophorus voltai]